MAVPIAPKCDITVCPSQDTSLLVAVLMTAIYAVVIAFTLFAFPEKTDDTNTKTPTKSKRTKEPVCPNAPKTKRQRVSVSPLITPSAARQLFAEDDNKKICPDAPIKTKDDATTDRRSNIKPQQLFTEDESEPVCPGAPIKTKANKSTVSKNNMSEIVTHFDFSAEQIHDIRTIPSMTEQLSAETKTICSFYKPNDNMWAIDKALNDDADTIDPTNPARVKPNVSIPAIINYILTINRLNKNLELLNECEIALPHSGTGDYTTRNSEHYFLIDKLVNASYNTNTINTQLSNILKEVYAHNKTKWTNIPETYIQACQLCREAIIISREFQTAVSFNMNLTSWADW